MTTSDFTTTLLVDKTPQEVFQAINHVRGWWAEESEGRSHQLNDEFTVRFGEHHVSKQKLIEVIPDQKVVWLVTDSQLTFLEGQNEWTNTKISFELAPHDNCTQIRFTHFGLVPQAECYHACVKGWTYFIKGSLFKLLTAGKGTPGIPFIP
jgi:hypothetical protein